MNIDLSVIIPVYNGEKYIIKCLESVNSQKLSYKELNVEIIIVDDGSHDLSKEIILDYANTSRFPIRYYYKENGGQGSARNYGIEKALGDYIAFVDQDDIVDECYFDNLYKEISNEHTSAYTNTSENVNTEVNVSRNTNVKLNVNSKASIKDYTNANINVVQQGYRTVDEDSGKVIEEVSLCETEWSLFMNITPWGKMFKRKFIVDNNIRFATLPLGEDIYFNFQIIGKCGLNGIKISRNVGYNWVQNRRSFSHTNHRKLSADSDLLPLFNSLIELPESKEWKDNPLFEYFFVKTAIYQTLQLCGNNAAKDIIQYKDTVFAWLNNHFLNYASNTYIKSIKGPSGERKKIALYIFVFMQCKRLGIENIIIYVLNFLFKR